MVRNTRDAAGLTLILGKDHYLAPGFYHVFKKMGELEQQARLEYNVLSLGTLTAGQTFSGIADKLKTKTWPAAQHNTGLPLTQDAYQKLSECRHFLYSR